MSANQFINIYDDKKKIGYIHMEPGFNIADRYPTEGAWFNYRIDFDNKSIGYINTTTNIRLAKTPIDPVGVSIAGPDDYHTSFGGARRKKKRTRRHKNNKKRDKRTRSRKTRTNRRKH